MPDVPQQERDFCRILVETGNPVSAGKLAGIDGKQAMTRLRVQRHLRDLLNARLLAIVPKMLGVMERLACDPAVPSAVRRLAAADILDRAGLVQASAAALAKPVESLSEMPARDLRALVERLEGELFARARPVRDLELEASQPAPREPKSLAFLD